MPELVPCLRSTSMGKVGPNQKTVGERAERQKSKRKHLYNFPPTFFHPLFCCNCCDLLVLLAVPKQGLPDCKLPVLNNSSHMLKYKFRMQHKFRAIITTCCVVFLSTPFRLVSVVRTGWAKCIRANEAFLFSRCSATGQPPPPSGKGYR